MRVANERVKDLENVTVSENTSEIVALFMRLRESSDGLPHPVKAVQ